MEWIGSKIKKRLMENELTQTKLADVLGVSRQTIDNWINGQVPKGQHLIALCQALQESPNYFFSETIGKTIVVPLHRTRKRAIITRDMQKEALELAQNYAIFFKKSQESDLVRVARVSERTRENAIKISEELRQVLGIGSETPIDYLHTFKLMERLGINVIIREFPKAIKSYAFYTKIHGHRVVFVNSSTNILDLIFPLLHESVHAIRDENVVEGEYDRVEEDFCDMVSNYTQFPNSYIKFVYETIYDLFPGTQINKLKYFSKKNGHSLFGVVARIENMYSEFAQKPLNVGGADTNLKKEFPTIGDVMFSVDDPGDYAKRFMLLSPNYTNKLVSQIEGMSHRKLAELLGGESVLDAQMVKQELAKLQR